MERQRLGGSIADPLFRARYEDVYTATSDEVATVSVHYLATD
jgi:hypothetical protein